MTDAIVKLRFASVNGTTGFNLLSTSPGNKESRCGFRAKHPLEARPGELHAHKFFSERLRIADMDNATLRVKVRLATPRSIVRKRDANFEVRADGHVKARQKGGAAATKIFARSVCFESHAAGVFSANAQDRKSTRLNSSHSSISCAVFC